MEKDNKNPIVKKYFDVRIETWLPATLLFRVLAENPEDVIQIIKGLKPNSIQYNLIGRKDINRFKTSGHFKINYIAFCICLKLASKQDRFISLIVVVVIVAATIFIY